MRAEELYVGELYVENVLEMLKPQWDDVVTPLALAGRLGNTDPNWTQLGSTGIYVPGFSASASNEVFFAIQLPHAAKVGDKFKGYYDPEGLTANEVRLHIHWAPSTNNTGNCRWEITYVIHNVGEATTAAVTEAVDVAANGVPEQEQINGLVAIDASTLRESSVLSCRLRRLGSHANDTFTGVALGLSVDAHVPIYRFGSEAEYGD